MGGTTARTGGRRVRLEVVHEARLCLDSPQPGLDGRIVRERDAGVAGDVGVGVEADVGDGVVRSEEEVVRARGAARGRRANACRPSASARRAPRGPPRGRSGSRSGRCRCSARAGSARRRATARRAPGRACRPAGAAFPRPDRGGSRPTRKVLPGLELEHRRPPRRVPRHVLRRLRLAGEEVDRHPLELEPELGGEQPHLVAVGGGGEVVETKHDYPPFTCER